MHNHSYENEFNLHVNEISFSYQRMSTKTRFEKEAKGYSEMAYWTNDERGFSEKREFSDNAKRCKNVKIT